jgi:bisphosphoglycerate-independent phosphoglycerate mutase (AlkP superfamily)
MLLRRACLQRFFATTTTTLTKRPVVLTILDGWGYREDPADNAVLLGHTPHFDALFGHHSARGQVGFLDACERDVGLPVGQIGNSEVGHMNIGAGRIVWQDICAIDNVVAKEALLQQEALQEHIEILQQNGGTCHLLGLVSPGGVHAMQDHMVAVANTVHAAGVPVVVHAFTDGRDVPPNDAIRTFPSFLEGLMPGVTVGSVTGRYYAMDRDNRWERVVTAFDVIVAGQGVAPSVETAMDAIHNAYQADLSDEFILPTVVGDYTGMKPGDGVFMANFRSDRAREILTALADANAYGDDHDGVKRQDTMTITNKQAFVVWSTHPLLLLLMVLLLFLFLLWLCLLLFFLLLWLWLLLWLLLLSSTVYCFMDHWLQEYEELHTLMMDRDPPTEQQPVLSTVTGMVQYSDRHNEFMTSVFPPKDITNSLGEVVSKAGLTQLRAAETEKYPHVTFFFNGGREQPFAGEDRILVRRTMEALE